MTKSKEQIDETAHLTNEDLHFREFPSLNSECLCQVHSAFKTYLSCYCSSEVQNILSGYQPTDVLFYQYIGI